MSPRNAEVSPQNAEMKPRSTEMRPHSAEMSQRSAKLSSCISEMSPHLENGSGSAALVEGPDNSESRPRPTYSIENVQ